MNEEYDFEEKAGFSLTREVYDWIESGITAVLSVVIVFTFVARMVSVDGLSMYPTLNDEDRLIASNMLYTPRYKDIVVVTKPTSRNAPLIKRVIATEGQTINFDFENGIVYVDGMELSEPYINELTHWHVEDVEYPLTVPKGHVFVMGDNRNNSWDSRDPEVGMVDNRYILGRVVFRLMPYDEMGKVD